MRIIAVLIIQFLLLRQIAFCQNDNSQSENLPKYPLKTIIGYCQKDSLNPISQTQLIYNEKKILIQSISFYDSTEKYVKEFTYNNNGLLAVLYSYHLRGDIKSREDKRIFNYNSDSLLTSELYENAPNNSKHENLYNAKGLLISRTISGIDWKQELTYEYDTLGRLFQKYKGKSHYITYEYSKNHLIKEIEHSKNTNETREITYEYNDSGLIINKKKNGKTVEKNIYDNNGQLKQRWTNDYGPDPCIFIPCCMQEISIFQYY